MEEEYTTFLKESDLQNTSTSTIIKRQEFYWLGRSHEEENQLPQAIEAFKIYSTHLAEEDQHIPHQWISQLYAKLGETIKSLQHLEEFAKGCTQQKAAEVYKELGAEYSNINLVQKAILCFENAIKNNPNIGVKKKLDELKKIDS